MCLCFCVSSSRCHMTRSALATYSLACLVSNLLDIWKASIGLPDLQCNIVWPDKVGKECVVSRTIIAVINHLTFKKQYKINFSHNKPRNCHNILLLRDLRSSSGHGLTKWVIFSKWKFSHPLLLGVVLWYISDNLR